MKLTLEKSEVDSCFANSSFLVLKSETCILLIISAKLCGSQNDNNQHYLASAVEMIHSATLLHDDVVDMSEIRRGKKTANALWDNKASILVGDYLFSLSFQ